MLHNYVAEHNEAIIKGEAAWPSIALAPLPAGAQFLNVIESVFSGMARAIIANSNYGSIDEARAAIDRYIQERNEKFRCTPKRAGGKIWGTELRTTSVLRVEQLQGPALLSIIRRPGLQPRGYRGVRRMLTINCLPHTNLLTFTDDWSSPLTQVNTQLFYRE
jgi:hypothetical protein